MPTFIRLTDYKDSDTKEQQFANPANRHTANQNDFSKIPGSPIAYWVSPTVKNAFEKAQKIGDISEPKVGLSTGDNDYFLRLWYEVSLNKSGFNFKSRTDAQKSQLKWFPFNRLLA